MKIIDKLSTYASLIGVIGAIGGGFYAWGEFNTRLSAIENKDFTINEVVDLTPVNDKIANIRVEVIDRIKAIEENIGVKAEMNFLEAQPGDVPITSSDNQLLNDWIEFMPSTSIDVGVKKFIDWYRKFYKI